MQYRAFWELLPYDPATSRNSKNFQSEMANTEEQAMRLVEEQGSGYVEVLDLGHIVRKMYLDEEVWRTEYPTDKQTHQKVDTSEYE